MSSSPARPLHLGISKHHSTGAGPLGELGLQLTHHLQTQLGREVRLELVPTYPDLVAGLSRGSLDVAWLPPLMQGEAEQHGARLVAVPQRGGWLAFRSALLVRRADALLQKAADLLGTRAAWRNAQSASGYLFPRLELLTVAHVPTPPFASERFYGSVLQAAEAVARGEADFCTLVLTEGAARDAARAEREVATALGPLAPALRVAHVTDLIPPDGLSVGRHVAPADETALTRALHALHTSPEGLQLVQQLLNAEKLVAVQPALLQSLRTWTQLAQARAAAIPGAA